MAAEAVAGEGEAQPKKGKMKFIIIGAAALIVIAGGGGAFMMLSGSKPAEAAGEHGATADAHGDASGGEHGTESFVFNLPTMTVNLNSEGGTQNFMKLTIALEVANQEAMTAIQPKMARVVDAFQIYLRELRKSDLEGSAGLFRLKEELLRRVNLAIAPAHVNGILFKEILVQ
jgi:flagellar protein FliL